MRYALLSDIHANLEALDAVLADARAQSCTDFVCLGDVVGYNANPGECVQRIQELECPVVKGNHDEQASIVMSTEGFNELAEEAIGWTREHLSAEDKAWLGDLRLTRQVGDFTIVHATLDTPGQWGYVFNDLDAIASFTYQQTALCFFGHTHWPTAFVRDDNVRRLAVGQIVLSPGKKYFINPGSIGQPRDRDWRAAYAIYDAERNLVEQRRVKYDLATAQRKVRDAGLPDRLAERLAAGR
ncbi:MAG TPA: metallophosphoesterase family protein [Chthoniobacterales bacterium]|jgi:predicted phosphodiesterase|nr:metallophosphoesterase family protein [Chthoniobacterales bacterium]